MWKIDARARKITVNSCDDVLCHKTQNVSWCPRRVNFYFLPLKRWTFCNEKIFPDVRQTRESPPTRVTRFSLRALFNRLDFYARKTHPHAQNTQQCGLKLCLSNFIQSIINIYIHICVYSVGCKYAPRHVWKIYVNRYSRFSIWFPFGRKTLKRNSIIN